jgi:hypothetical protein
MRRALHVVAAFAAFAAVVATAALAAGDEPAVPATSAHADSAWEFALTAYPTDVRGGERFTSAIATADHGPLHLQARYNYESVGARSAFVGWSFSGGEDFTWEVRPLLGGAWGTLHAFVPGLQASLGWRQLDFYTEAEYVHDNHAHSGSYTYAWSELGYRPIEWLRLGVAGQRTRLYGGDRDFQRGPFAQVTWSTLTIGGYWFNPGSSDQVFVGSIGLAF